MSRLKDALVSAGYGLGWSVLSRLPEAVSLGVFRLVAEVAWRRQGPSVQVLEGNLRRVLGPAATGAEVRAVSRESMRSYARYWLEVFRLPVMPLSRLVSGMEDDSHGNVQVALDHLAAGRGVIFALPHAGNWDQAAAWIIAKGAGSITTVAERLKPESLYERFVGFREGLGMVVLPASGGDRPFGILARSLRAGKCVCLPCDRDIGGHGVEVDFFGEKAQMAPGPAALAERTGAALMPVMLWFTEEGWGVSVGAEIPVPGRPGPEGAHGRHDAGRRALLRARDRAAPAGLAHVAAGVHRGPGPAAAGRRAAPGRGGRASWPGRRGRGGRVR